MNAQARMAQIAKNRQRAGDSNWMPKEAPLRLASLAKTENWHKW